MPGHGTERCGHARGRDVLGAGRGFPEVVVAHGDLPGARRLRPPDRRQGGVTAVPDRRGDGTNVLCVPARVPGFGFSYGAGSFRRHRDEALRLGLPLRVRHDPDLTLGRGPPRGPGTLALTTCGKRPPACSGSRGSMPSPRRRPTRSPRVRARWHEPQPAHARRALCRSRRIPTTPSSAAAPPWPAGPRPAAWCTWRSAPTAPRAPGTRRATWRNWWCSRQAEQREAARRLGATGEVVFLGYTDGELEAHLGARALLASWIRRLRPAVVLGHDPVEALPDPSRSSPGRPASHRGHRGRPRSALLRRAEPAGAPSRAPAALRGRRGRPLRGRRRLGRDQDRRARGAREPVRVHHGHRRRRRRRPRGRRSAGASAGNSRRPASPQAWPKPRRSS